MPTPFKPIRYRYNPRPVLVTGRSVEGPKTWDEQSGFYCYESDIVIDDFGTRVDSRATTFDVDHKEEGERGN